MGSHFVRSSDDLGDDLVLSPERYASRSAGLAAHPTHRRLADWVEVRSENLRPAALAASVPVLVLDTTHAQDGFVLARHAPQSAGTLGSAKRALQPGDVIVSRLRPYLRQIAYVDAGLFQLVPQGNGVVASSEFFVLRKRAALEPIALVPFLLSAPVQRALSAGQEGGHHPRFRHELLASLPVPDAVIAQADATATCLRAHAESVRAALLASQHLAAAAERACTAAEMPELPINQSTQ